MPSRHRAFARFLAAVALLMSVPSGALGQSEPRAEARQIFVKGAELFEAGAYLQALEVFRQAYKLLPSHKILFNIAATEAALGQGAAAIRDYSQAVEDPASNLSVEERAEATRMIKSLRQKVTEVTVHVTQPGSEVVLDGERIGTSPLRATLWLDPGAHSVQLVQHRKLLVSRRIEARPGQVLDIVLDHTAEEPTEAVAHQSRTPDPIDAKAFEATQPSPLKTWGYISLIGGGLLVGGGGVLYGLADRDYDRMLESTDQRSYESARSSGQGKETASISLFAVGGAAILTGGAFLWIAGRSAPSHQPDPTRVGLAPWMARRGYGMCATWRY